MYSCYKYLFPVVSLFWILNMVQPTFYFTIMFVLLYNVFSRLRKGVYNLIEVISNEPNK
jgi:hypothetical protein